MKLPIPFPTATISLAYGAVDGKYYTFASPHRGTDFSSRSRGVVAGTAFRASGPGVVVRSGVGPEGVAATIDRPNNLAGNSIDVDYGDFIARYMHRPLNSPSPRKGDRVTEGTLLGVVGNTGLSGGAHLHLETWDKRTRRRVDPANYFDFTRTVTTGGGSAAGGQSGAFTPVITEEDELMGAKEDILGAIDANTARLRLEIRGHIFYDAGPAGDQPFATAPHAALINGAGRIIVMEAPPVSQETSWRRDTYKYTDTTRTAEQNRVPLTTSDFWNKIKDELTARSNDFYTVADAQAWFAKRQSDMRATG